jgi:alpha-tubulin suppressor-like RCC1 family protein
MRPSQPSKAIAVIGALLLLGTIAVRAQVNGNATITGSAFGVPLTVSTSNQFGGSVSSIKWGGKEYINNWDHGRQLGVNMQFFNRYCCYNPYETGSFEDAKGPTSTSKVLSLTASGNRLEATTQMCWNFREFNQNPVSADSCGDPAQWLPITPYSTPLSNYRVHKTITIGFANIPNVIEYLTDEFIPEPVLKGNNNVTAVLNYDFSSLRSWDVVSKDYRTMRALAGVDDRIKVVSTADGNYAMGWYAPELLQPFGEVGVANWWLIVPPDPFYRDPKDPSKLDLDYACVHFGGNNRYESFNGPGNFSSGRAYGDRAYLVIGNLGQVKDSLANLHLQFASLDPEVFDWREYRTINGFQSALPTPEAAQQHWLTQGMGQGIRGSTTFSPSQYLQLNPDLASAFGSTNYQAAIDHYVKTGRAEGRNTVAKPAAGMQHITVVANRIVNAAGQNAFGQLGTSTPPHIASLDNTVTEVAAGDYTSFAVKNDGSLWVWGSNQYGARGDGSSGDNIADPVQVPLPNRISTPSRRGKHAVAVGVGVYAAIDTDGQVWTWGVNWNGRLGDGTTTSHYTPSRVKRSASPNDYLTGIVSISAGGGTVAAVDADGAVWTWGAGANGALGNGFTFDTSLPVQVLQPAANNTTSPLVGTEQVACGSSGFCIALARNGTVYGWGSNSFSQLGIAAGGSLSIATPIGISPSGRIDLIAAGSAHCIAHSPDGNVYGWGYNGRGQLGIGSTAVAVSPPAVMSTGPDGMTDINDLVAGGNFSVMVRNSDRAVFVAGDNQSGQLATPSNQPAQLLPTRSAF